MNRKQRLQARLARARFGMRRQLKLFRATGKQGHLKQFRTWKERTRLLRIELAEIRKAEAGPKIVTAAEIGIHPSGIFGELGTPIWLTGHYTAGPKDTSDQHAIALAQSFDRYHRGQGWGGSGYHYLIARSGTIIGLRPVAQKGAHVGGANTGNVGVVMNGTIGDKPTAAQARSLRWLIDNAHTNKMPAAHRAPRSLAGCQRRGHNDWAGHQSNSCPGSFKPMYLRGGNPA